MSNDPLTIGCHLSSSKGYLTMARQAVELGGNTFQFFTRNPRGGRAKDLDPADLAAFHEFCAENGIERILAHAPYTLNPCSAKEETREFARMTLSDDLMRMESTPGQLYNMHPGSATGQPLETAIEQITGTLNECMLKNGSTTVLLETMAGKGSEVGRCFDELASIIAGVNDQEHIGVCLDTCHVWEGGYDIVDDLDGVLDEFDRTIGLDRLYAIHLNDSKNPRGAHKDRHERIGEGHIGFEALSAIVSHPALQGLPFFLETPQEKMEGYAKEIARLREAHANRA